MPEDRFAKMNAGDEEHAHDTLLQQLSKASAAESRAADIVTAELLAGSYRYSPALGWLAWDGRRWDAGDITDEAVVNAVRLFMDRKEREFRTTAVEAETVADGLKATIMARVPEGELETFDLLKKPEEPLKKFGTKEELQAYDDAVRKARNAAIQAGFWLNFLSGAKIRSITGLCRAMDDVLTRTTDFDTHADLLNCTNGVADLRTGELLKHDPNLLMTKITAGSYEKDATHAKWKEALVAVAPGCDEWLQTRLGQSATGEPPDDDALLIAHGGGANAKSTIMTAVKVALGDYASTVAHKTLTEAGDRAHGTEFMTYRGLRMALLEETPEEGHLDPQRIKQTVGTDSIRARYVYRNEVEFPITHTMWINTNHRPQVATTDHGTWRRLVMVPWPYRFRKPHEEIERATDKRGDPNLRSALTRNVEPEITTAVLAYLVEGATRWYDAKCISPEPPEAVKKATEEWREDSNVVLKYVRDRLVADPTACVLSGVMMEDFNTFLSNEGKRGMSAQTFNSRLEDTLTAEKITISATPSKKARVRKGDKRHHPLDLTVHALQEKQVLRMWRGVRFRRSTDKADEEDPHLHAVGSEGTAS